jgi:hypothetical protein
MARVDEVGDGLYRISTTVADGEGAFQFNQFLIDDERPTLIYTGMYPTYEDVRKAVAEATEEVALNALFKAETVMGRDGHMLHALPIDRTLDLLRGCRPI